MTTLAHNPHSSDFKALNTNIADLFSDLHLDSLIRQINEQFPRIAQFGTTDEQRHAQDILITYNAAHQHCKLNYREAWDILAALLTMGWQE